MPGRQTQFRYWFGIHISCTFHALVLVEKEEFYLYDTNKKTNGVFRENEFIQFQLWPYIGWANVAQVSHGW